MRNTFAKTMLEVGLSDHKLAVLVGDIGHFSLQPFAKACPGRFYNLGILEPTLVSVAAGLAHAGLHPVGHTIAPFLIERSFEQIKLDFCYQNLGGTLISVGSAFDYSGLGCSHHCYGDLGMMKSLPNSQVIYPASPREFEILFRQTYQNAFLTYFRLPNEKHEIELKDQMIQFGKGILVKSGKDLTVVATGPELKRAMLSLPLLIEKGIDPEILYFPTIKPFDADLVRASVLKTKRVLVIEQHSQFGGTGDDVLHATANLGTSIQYQAIQIPDQFQRSYGEYETHLTNLGFTSENILFRSSRMVFPEKF